MPTSFKTISLAAALAAVLVTLALMIPAASSQTPQTTAGTHSAPPDLASPGKYQTTTVKASMPGTVDAVRSFMDANPITDFVAATDAIPAITGITYLTGTWPEVGATRQVQLDGGFTVQERVLVNTEDNFVYQIWDITAPAGRFIDHIKGEFRYIQNGDTVDVIWDYNVKPAIFVARPFIRRYLTRDFGPFMRAGMEGVTAAYAAR